MPVGVMADMASVILGGIAGTKLKQILTINFRDNLNLILGLCSLGMGISSLVLMEHMPPVILSIIIGTCIGNVLHLEQRIYHAGEKMQNTMGGRDKSTSPEYTDLLVTAIVLFCSSGTGIYGAMIEGIAGEHTILIAKSILDFFTAAIFACSLGTAVSFIAIPQGIIFLLLFFLSGRIPSVWMESSIINDFKACGGFILVATGFRMLNMKKFSITEMVPAMVFVMPISYVWIQYIVPLL
jgi:hypothetical protein